MRMWMVNPKHMCNKHLLGEHVEHHMFVGTIRQKKRLDGYVAHNCVELLSLEKRHNDLVKEMENRGMNHKSKLLKFNTNYLDKKIVNAKVNRKESKKNLFGRCKDCRRLAK